MPFSRCPGKYRSEAVKTKGRPGKSRKRSFTIRRMGAETGEDGGDAIRG